jgi:hypothetical protein
MLTLKPMRTTSGNRTAIKRQEPSFAKVATRLGSVSRRVGRVMRELWFGRDG